MGGGICSGEICERDWEYCLRSKERKNYWGEMSKRKKGHFCLFLLITTLERKQCSDNIIFPIKRKLILLFEK